MENLNSDACSTSLSKEEREFRLRSEAQRRRRAREREIRERELHERVCEGFECEARPRPLAETHGGLAARPRYEVAQMDTLRACSQLRRSVIRSAIILLEDLLCAVEQEDAGLGLRGDAEIDQRLQSTISRIVAIMGRSQDLIAAVKGRPI